ncbi:coiled-coil domain-containing protein 187 isoform X1 [Oryzias melastigma]|uniref:coiled-coil domain-containing protein 187 isoform X1 n=1 Tax=Oryzias melastigma TaxID=30732 RepID=UPI00168CE2BF|nr:coiled-coil domain-containing protein 187 isoform X1 [Oryzias melastigma]XP_036068716.1 coiled-coil domain-containing protein 187 isoform X1 [Oryzias melastigma]
MAELEIDQSNLPRVHEVCQTFAVLEDGALAHNLQEQEIEQYYSTNVQKNQLVQNDIRLAKRMQDEEEEQQAHHSALLRQASRQIEEQDLEYARVVQEELQRSAEEARRREQHDAEIAKRLQEEEEQWMRRRSSREHDGHPEGSAAEPERLPAHPEEQCSSTAIRGHCFTSHRSSEFHEPRSPRRVRSRNSRTSWSNQGQTGPVRQMTDDVSEESEDSDTVFNQQLSLWSKRLYEGLSTAPPRRRTSIYQPYERNNTRVFSNNNFTDDVEEEAEDWDEDYRLSRYQDGERRRRREDDRHRSRNEETDDGLAGAGGRRRSRSESVRLHDRSDHRNKVLARTWSHKDNADKRVSFQDDDRSSYREQRKNSQVWEMLGHILRERGVPVKIGGSGAPLQIRPQSRDSQVLHGSEVSYGDFQPHQRVFQRTATARHSFHGDVRERRRLSYRENSSRDHREAPDRSCENGEVSKICRGDSFISNCQRRGSRRRKELKHTNGDKNGERMPDNCRVRRATSERGHRITEERFSSEEEEEVQERRAERPRRRALLRSQSLRISKASSRHRSRPVAGGASLEPEPRKASLDMGELHQVLKDEELARKLQKEEEKLLSRNSRPSSGSTYPVGDFRVAQVAQDEEIARYMQKQEIQSKRRSRELEGPGSWREHRLMISHHDRQATRGRQVQRERLDSEGLPSPTEDCSPEDQPPSPTATTPKDAQIRNVAEELDPTFQARRHDAGNRAGQSGPVGGSPPISPSGFHDFLEEPTFIPPTKRQAEKSEVKKQKPKKETCKQQ